MAKSRKQFSALEKLRTICPNPLPALNHNWLTSTVVQITSVIAAEGTWGSLPILADALQDAGCDNAYILDHCRQTFCQRGCWCANTAAGFAPDRKCRVCGGKGWVDDTTRPTHPAGKFPDLAGGCWEGTCWVVQLLLQQPQRLVAVVPRAHANDDPLEAPAVNPGECDGKTWLVGIEEHADVKFFVVEARYTTDVEDKLVDDPLGAFLRLDPAHLGDFVTDAGDADHPPEYSCHFSADGNHPYIWEDISVYGAEYLNPPYAVSYVGPGIPGREMAPVDYADCGPCDICNMTCYPAGRSRESVRKTNSRVCEPCLPGFIKKIASWKQANNRSQR